MTMTVMIIIIMLTTRISFSPTLIFFSFLFFMIFFSTLLFSILLYSFHLYSAFFCTGYFLSGTNEHEGNVFVFVIISIIIIIIIIIVFVIVIIIIIVFVIVIIIIMRKYNPIVIEVNISYRTYDLPMITGIFNFLSAFTESIGCRTVMLERIPWENRVSLW